MPASARSMSVLMSISNVNVPACQMKLVNHQLDERGKDHGAKATATGSYAHGQTKPAAEEMVDHVYGRQVHHAETKTSQKADCDVEYHERGVLKHLSADNVLLTRRAVMVLRT